MQTINKSHKLINHVDVELSADAQSCFHLQVLLFTLLVDGEILMLLVKKVYEIKIERGCGSGVTCKEQAWN